MYEKIGMKGAEINSAPFFDFINCLKKIHLSFKWDV